MPHASERPSQRAPYPARVRGGINRFSYITSFHNCLMCDRDGQAHHIEEKTGDTRLRRVKSFAEGHKASKLAELGFKAGSSWMPECCAFQDTRLSPACQERSTRRVAILRTHSRLNDCVWQD